MKKIFNIIRCLIVLTATFLMPLTETYAYQSWIGYTKISPSLTVRSTAEFSNFNKIEEIPPYISFRVVDETNSSDGKFYKIVYGDDNRTGWVYYQTIKSSSNPTTTYGRPWTTPGKAIIGGAEYIADGFISAGQSTSYLKKFQVNPNASVSLYSNQWMTNIRAPYYEARTTYSAYSEYLDTVSFTFKIPVYNNLPESTSLSGMTNNGTTLTKEELNDSAFEEEMNNQGFPESYKKYLRSLHKKYPNWIFKALKTNLDYNTVVANELGNKSCIETSSGHGTNEGCGNESASWALADEASVRYFIDPRNFLDKESIFMFEDLSSSENVTESMVQRILNNSFMSGKSEKDNKTYAKLFLEAGQKHGVNAIYLASLSIQELGRTGNVIQAQGSTIEYYGIKYSSLYNFYNIGASGSWTARGGIVWASGGDPSTYSFINDISDIDTGGTTITTPVNLDKYITSAGYKISGNYIYGIGTNTSVSTLKNKISGVDIQVNSNGNIVGTGSTITLSKDGTSYTKTIIVTGDVDGDGKIAATDYVAIKNSIMEISSLSDVQKQGADMNNNSRVDAGDYVAIKNYIMNN